MSDVSSDRRKRMLTVTQMDGFTKLVEVNRLNRSDNCVSVFQDRDINVSNSGSVKRRSGSRGGIISPSATARKSGRNIPAPSSLSQRTPATTPLATTAPTAPLSSTPREGSVFTNNYSRGSKPDLLSTSSQNIFSSTSCSHQPVPTPKKHHRVITTPVKTTTASTTSLRNSVTAPERRKSVPAPPQCFSKKVSSEVNLLERRFSASEFGSFTASEPTETTEVGPNSDVMTSATCSDDKRIHSLTTRLQNAELRAAALSDEKVEFLQKISQKEQECRTLSKQVILLGERNEPSACPIPRSSSLLTVKPELRDQPSQTEFGNDADKCVQTTTQFDSDKPAVNAGETPDCSPGEVARLRETVALLESVLCQATDDCQVSDAEMRARLLEVVKKSLGEKEQLTRKLYTLEIQQKKESIKHDSICDQYESQLSELRAEVSTLRSSYKKKDF